MRLCLILFFFSFDVIASEKLNEIFQAHTSLKNPASLRDPFQPPMLKKEIGRNDKTMKTKLDSSGNIVESLETMRLVGVLIGKKRSALIRFSDAKDAPTKTYSEGDRIGRGGPEVKAILRGGLILVDKITNIYGENEYIETVVPISK